MEQITNLSVDILKVHPRNTEFFDDIQGEQYEKFKNSIKEDGILTPLIVSPDMTIISGHQRYQAAKDLNIGLVPVIIKEELLDEKEKLKKLLATNFGRLKNDPVKQGRVFKEYEELCGIEKGNNQWTRKICVSTQEQIAKELGVSVRHIQNLKKLNSLSPDIQELISDGTVKYTTALNVWGKLTNEDQSKLIEELGKDKIKEMKAKDTKEYIDKIRKLEQALVEEKNKPPKVVTEVVDKTDYESISKLKCTIQDKEKELIGIKSQKKILEDRLECLEHDTEEYERLKDEISNLIETKTSLGKQIQGVKKTTELLYDVDKLLKMIAPAKYSQAIFDLKDDVVVLENLHTMIDLVQQWCVEFRGLLPQKETKTIYMEAEVIE